MSRGIQPKVSNAGTKKRNGKTVYPSMRMIRRVRHWMSKQVKAVFDAESNPGLMDSDIAEKARLAKLTVEEYKNGLEELNNSPTGLLMLTLAQLERDFLKHWWERMQKATKWAEDNKDYKAIATIEKEKQLTVERLIKAGRLLSRFEQEKEEGNSDQEEELGILPNEIVEVE